MIEIRFDGYFREQIEPGCGAILPWAPERLVCGSVPAQALAT